MFLGFFHEFCFACYNCILNKVRATYTRKSYIFNSYSCYIRNMFPVKTFDIYLWNYHVQAPVA